MEACGFEQVKEPMNRKKHPTSADSGPYDLVKYRAMDWTKVINGIRAHFNLEFNFARVSQNKSSIKPNSGNATQKITRQ